MEALNAEGHPPGSLALRVLAEHHTLRGSEACLEDRQQGFLRLLSPRSISTLLGRMYRIQPLRP